MQGVVVGVTEQDIVAQIAAAAVAPPDDVVGLALVGSSAAAFDDAFSVTDAQGRPLRAGDGAGGASVVDPFDVGRQGHGADVGVAHQAHQLVAGQQAVVGAEQAGGERAFGAGHGVGAGDDDDLGAVAALAWHVGVGVGAAGVVTEHLE